ncbi:MAG: GNAT family N-acetyltransferase [Bacteroidales bacterium]|nr:GNAT family N-acetyltransferase [Bacteroidales bacterium]
MKKERYLIRLVRLAEAHTIAFKEEMQEAFQHGFEAYNKDAEETNQWQVLPDKDFYQSLNADGAVAYEAIGEDDQRVGGAIIIIDEKQNMGESRERKTVSEPMEQREQSQAGLSSAESQERKTAGELAFLYVKVGVQSKGIGQAIWRAIEGMHSEIALWETCTPYFDRRNIHFYINRCGFQAVEFYNEHHPDPNMPEQFDQEDGLFRFEKRMK